MRKKFSGVLLCAVLLMTCALAGTAQKRAEVFTFGVATGASNDTFDLTRSGGYASKHTVQYKVSGGPSGCTFRLEGTNLGPEDSPVDADFSSLSGDITCTSNGMVHVVNKPVRTVRMFRSTWSGGSSPTLTVYYTYGQ